MLISIVLIHILICIVFIFPTVHTVFINIFLYKDTCYSASEPRCSTILVHAIWQTFISTHVYFDNKIQFNSLYSCFQ